MTNGYELENHVNSTSMPYYCQTSFQIRSHRRAPNIEINNIACFSIDRLPNNHSQMPSWTPQETLKVNNSRREESASSTKLPPTYLIRESTSELRESTVLLEYKEVNNYSDLYFYGVAYCTLWAIVRSLSYIPPRLATPKNCIHEALLCTSSIH